MMRKIFGILLITFVAGCLNLNAIEKPKIKIGAVVPLSGTNGYLGEDIRKGMELAKEQLKDCPYDIELIYEDSVFDNTKTVMATQKLLNVDKVDAIVSLWSVTARLVAPLTDKKKVIHFAIAWNPYLPRDYKYTFTHETTATDFAQATLDILKKEGAKKIAMLSNNVEGYLVAPRELKRLNSEQHVVEIVADEIFNLGERDFRLRLSKIKTQKPDALVIFSLSPEREILIKQIKELQVPGMITGYLQDMEDLKMVEGTTFISGSDGTDAFKAMYQKRYGKLYNIDSPHAYDILNLIVNAYKHFPDHKANSDELKQALLTVKNYSGAVGVLNVDSYGVFNSPAELIKVENGKKVKVK
jgi:branched-chain amino acid transport system substrate-binding protein